MPAALEAKPAPFVTALWGRKRPLMLERIALLERTAEAALQGVLELTLLKAAINEAHNLAGSLGTFGFPEGTEIARELEEGLEAGNLPPDRLRELTVRLRTTLFPLPCPDALPPKLGPASVGTTSE